MSDTIDRWLKIDPPEPEYQTFEGWEQWERDASRNSPVAWFIRRTVPRWFAQTWRVWVHEPWYWLKCRFWHRHNVLVIKSLPPTWTDRDTRLLHASFQLLADFIEREEPYGIGRTREQLIADYDFSYEGCDPEINADIRKAAEERADTWQEVQALYDWWKVRSQSDEDDDHYAEDTEMICRLAKVRKCLWT